MLKIESSSVRQKNRGSSHVHCRESKKKAANRINLIKQEADGGVGNLTELKAKIGILVQEALDELQKIRGKSLQSQPKTAAQEDPLGQSQIQDDWETNPLNIEMERLLFIKKWLEEPPASVPDQRTAAAGPETVVPAWQKVLIVDDDPTTVKILTHFLEREKYIVTSSLSGADGLEKAFREKPRLILLDIMIPDLNGFQFLSRLRKNQDLASVPVILLSMLTQEADILKGLEIGAVDYVTKPFSPAILLAKIKKYMRQEK
jgi:CheY-like chemotaxis protein